MKKNHSHSHMTAERRVSNPLSQVTAKQIVKKVNKKTQKHRKQSKLEWTKRKK